MDEMRHAGDGPMSPGPDGRIPVGLSTASVYPSPVQTCFELAADLGYDGVEVMVQGEHSSQDADELAALIDRHQMPVLSVHSPCLLLTARVWGTDPLVKIDRSVDLAERIGARVVVAHPPFLWQREAADSFAEAVAELQDRTDVRIAIENMFPIRVAGALVNTYRPHWDPVPAGYGWFTLDLSHTATSGTDALDMLRRMGPALGHLHLADGTGARRDEHLVPGRGTQPCGQVLSELAGSRFDGAVVVEVATRGLTEQAREADLAESLTFARWHLDASAADEMG